jgi:signal transduction histidine kinase
VATEARSADPLLIRANKLDLLERLADALAHEIKNPLHSMVINLEVLKRRLARAGAGEQDDVLRYIGVLGGELERVNRRIELLLRLSRPGRGAEPATLNELTEELMELVQLEARHRDTTVEYDPGTHLARVHVPREPARQVILNLVLDVLDGLAPGEPLRIRVAQEEGRSQLVVEGSYTPGPSEPDEDGFASRYGVARTLAETIGGRVDPLGVPAGTPDDSAAAAGVVFSLPASRG